ncbi:MAG: ATP-binding cassette domain-containing protein [Bacteroidales bacterium]|nr:ATP-binding cassette domain-containing protein [Bacteroidales bacterium]
MQTSMPNSEEETKVPETVETPVPEGAQLVDETPAATEEVTAEVEQTTAPVAETPNESPVTVDPNSVVSFKNVNISHRKLRALTNISFQLKKGEFVYLIGKTGSGKSSILKTLIAEIRPEGAEANMIGYDLLTLKSKKIPELRKKIGVVFQDYQLLNDKTVLENLMFVLRATRWKDRQAMLARCQEVLALVGLTTKDFKLPSQLSGGEQQRVCIARALLNSPDVILADEPTGNLDPISAEEIFQVFHNINKAGTTVLMATHNFQMIDKFPSRTICIEDGKLIDSGV